MDTIDQAKIKTVRAEKIDDTLYIDSPRKKFLPAYVYYILEYHKCDKVCFANSRTIYEKESLKDKEDWKEIK